MAVFETCSPPTKIFFCAHNKLLTDALGMALNSTKSFRVVKALSERPFVSNIRTLRPKILIIEPGAVGVEAPCLKAEIDGVLPDARVMLISTAEECFHPAAVFDMGLHGVIDETMGIEDVIKSCSIVSVGGYAFAPKPTPKDAGKLRVEKPETKPTLARLSRREQVVLKSVALGMASKEIAAEIEVCSKTVDTYKRRAMEKLSLKNRTSIVKFALESGWLQ